MIDALTIEQLVSMNEDYVILDTSVIDTGRYFDCLKGKAIRHAKPNFDVAEEQINLMRAIFRNTNVRVPEQVHNECKVPYERLQRELRAERKMDSSKRNRGKNRPINKTRNVHLMGNVQAKLKSLLKSMNRSKANVQYPEAYQATFNLIVELDQVYKIKDRKGKPRKLIDLKADEAVVALAAYYSIWEKVSPSIVTRDQDISHLFADFCMYVSHLRNEGRNARVPLIEHPVKLYIPAKGGTRYMFNSSSHIFLRRPHACVGLNQEKPAAKKWLDLVIRST